MKKEIKKKIGEIVDEIYEAGRIDKVYGRLDKINQILELFEEEKQKALAKKIKEIEELKYKDKDFLGQDNMGRIGMKMRNMVLDQVLLILNQIPISH